MMEILKKMNDEENESADSDDSEDEEDLEVRLQNIDLDNAEDIWDKLTKSERQQFDELVKSGDLASVLPEYNPWWCYKSVVPKIKDLDEPEDDDSFKKNCPLVFEGVADFDNICKNPSPYLRYGLLNLLYSYAYAVKYFSGDYKEEFCQFVEIVQLLAKNLHGHNYDLADTALESAASEVNNHEYLTISLEFSREVKKDVWKIVGGPSGCDNFYVLSALSDLRSQFEKTAKHFKKDKEKNLDGNVKDSSRLPLWLRSTPRKPQINLTEVKKHLKKIEFYLSWCSHHSYQINQTIDFIG